MTAVLAGTVDAIYRELQGIIEMEIDMGEGTRFREMVLAALDEKGYWDEVNSAQDPDAEADVPPSADCCDFSEWEHLIDSLRTDVLEDYDFDMEGEFLDLPPDQVAVLKQTLNIRPDYFTVVIEDPTGEKVAAIRREVRILLQ